MKSYGYSYTPSETIDFQGNSKKLQRHIHEGYRVVAGGNGSYVLAKSAYGVVYEMEGDKKVARRCANDFIRKHYKRSKITEKAYIQLVSDLNAGKVKFTDLY